VRVRGRESARGVWKRKRRRAAEVTAGWDL
jgi:hypothetical protein